MSKLVIVESPAKAIGKYLGTDYVVKASMGHLRDLPKKKMSVDIEHDFKPVYMPIEGKEKLIEELREDIDNSDFVYLATDPDREGEAISWHLKELFHLSDSFSKRVTLPNTPCRTALHTHAILIWIWSMPSRHAVFWIASWAMSCRRFCGERSSAVCPPAVCSRLQRAWLWIERWKSVPLCRKNIGLLKQS